MPKTAIKGTIGPTQELMERTILNKDENNAFLQWIARNKIKDLDHPDSHYDYRGFWKANPDFAHQEGEHYTDQFKQHGHPTFSNESQYSEPSGDGGRWQDNEWFVPSNKDILDILNKKRK